MARKRKNWLTPSALKLIDEVWQERVMILLQDLSELPHLKYTYVVHKNGDKLTETIGLGSKILKNNSTDSKVFSRLAVIVEEFLKNLEHPFPAHLLIELEDELLFVGATGEVILVAAFDESAPRGYMTMKLSKRIAYLRRLFRTKEKGITYV